ncbi:Bromodomain adjacent to zinc finger domain protein 1A, bromodomain [Sergentomyia squamirostris]
MPLMKRKEFKPRPPPADLRDDEEVFYCSITKEVFRNHEEYFEHVMLINSMLWTCSLTNKSGLTYTEALDSEKAARETLENFSKPLRIAVTVLLTFTKRSGFNDLADEIYAYMKDRYFRNEEVIYVPKEGSDQYGKVLDLLKGSKDCAEIEYTIELGRKKEIITAKGCDLRRNKLRLTRDKLKLFIRDNCHLENGMVVVKENVLQKYTNNGTIKFNTIHIGDPPAFVASAKVLQVAAQPKNPKKQAQISKYFSKDGGKKSDAKLEASNREIEEINRQAAEKLAERKAEEQKRQAEEREKQKQELYALVLSSVRTLNQVNEDLLLQDQKMLPAPLPMDLLIPKRFYSEFLLVLEFMCSFSEILEIRDKFPRGVTIPILQRAFLTRDVAGPLSDIFQVLLATIFSLENEEQNEITINYIRFSKAKLERARDPVEHAEIHAAQAMHYCKNYLANVIQDLPMDATTLSEILRLHLLSSGARLKDDQAARLRFQTRGGYRNADNPGLHLRLRHSHILRALSNRTLYELPLGDIFKILDCLISQIMTYPSVRDIIEERLEKAKNARVTIKNLTFAERRRLTRLETERKDLREEAQKTKDALEGTDAEKEDRIKAIDKTLQRKLDVLTAESNKAQKVFLAQLEKNKSQCFDYQLYLGSDRAHRKYWLFNSLPGLFVEHSEEDVGPCQDEVTRNIPELTKCPPDQRYRVIKQLVTDQYKMNEKENKKRINGSKAQSLNTNFNGVSEDCTISQKDLWMCTAVRETCPVHNSRYPGKVQWSYFHTAEEIDALTTALNTRGFREKALREQLELERELIVAHVITCPHDILQMSTDQKDEILARYLADQKRYEGANFHKDGADINQIMSSVLCDYILDLEWKISQGYLGANKASNRQKWREAVAKCDYNAMKNGFQLTQSTRESKSRQSKGGDKNKDEKVSEDKEKDDDDEDDDDMEYEDPGIGLPDSMEVDTEDSADEAIPLQNFDEEKKKVQFLATALISVKRIIDTKYLKWPLGVAKEKPKGLSQKIPRAARNLENWETALSHAMNYSQVFLHYNILYDSIMWTESAHHAACQICRRKSDPEEMLLCDECNSGCHMFCLKPPLTVVPKGDWYCVKCKKPEAPPSARKRKIFKEDESSEEEDNTQNESDYADDDSSDTDRKTNRKKTKSKFWNFSDGSDEECDSCHKSGKLIKCSSCSSSRHSNCINKKDWVKPGKKWECSKCRKGEEARASKRTSKREAVNGKPNTSATTSRRSAIRMRLLQSDPESDEEDVERSPPAKKARKNSTNTPRRSLRSQDESKQDAVSARDGKKLRRSNEDLPLDSVALYAFLDAIAKHPDSWPFIRPVEKKEVPDYYEIIKQPMDLAKVKSKLNCGEYATNYSVIKDIELIFNNCDAYNNSDSEIYKSGIRLERFVMEKCKELKLPFKHSDMISDDEENKSPALNKSSSRSSRGGKRR